MRPGPTRLAVFIDDGVDCYVFFRHDDTGESALRALALRAAVERYRGLGGGMM